MATLGSVARSHLSRVATCRQTVEAFLAPLSTAWERVATGCVLVVATCRQTVKVFPSAVHRLGAGGYEEP